MSTGLLQTQVAMFMLRHAEQCAAKLSAAGFTLPKHGAAGCALAGML